MDIKMGGLIVPALQNCVACHADARLLSCWNSCWRYQPNQQVCTSHISEVLERIFAAYKKHQNRP